MCNSSFLASLSMSVGDDVSHLGLSHHMAWHVACSHLCTELWGGAWRVGHFLCFSQLPVDHLFELVSHASAASAFLYLPHGHFFLGPAL